MQGMFPEDAAGKEQVNRQAEGDYEIQQQKNGQVAGIHMKKQLCLAIILSLLIVFSIPFLGAEEPATTTALFENGNPFQETGQWISPPNCVNNGTDCIAYILNNNEVENFYGDYYFYDWYTTIRDHKTSQILVEDSRWIIEELQKNGKWKELDLYSKELEFNDTDENSLYVKRISTNGVSTLTEEYRFNKGTPHIDILFKPSSDGIYRIIWRNTGIAGDEIKTYKFNELGHTITNNEKITSKKEYNSRKYLGVEFTDDTTDRFLYKFGWADTFTNTTNETLVSNFIVEPQAKGKKLDIIYGEFDLKVGEEVRV
jgi:hypothetical protein